MENNGIKVNLNGITFNVYCNSDTEIKRIERVFDKMFSCDYNLAFSDAMFNIYVDNSIEKYNEMCSKLLSSKSRYIKPNIYEYEFNNLTIYHHYSGFYVHFENNNFHIISNNSKYASYYLILEIYLKMCEMNDFYLFHGNGIKIEETPMNIIGYSHSGKTTLMSKLFQIDTTKKSFLSNDRILIGNDRTLYFPIDINLDINTVTHDKYLTQGIKFNEQKAYVDPKTFVMCYPNLNYTSNSDNHYFIIPKIDLMSRKNLDITNIREKDAIKILKYCCFSLEDKECLRDDWIIKNDIELEKRVNELVTNITKRYKILSVEYGCDLDGEEIYERIRKKN